MKLDTRAAVTKELGRSGICVPRLIVGGNVFGATVSTADSFAILDRFFDAGLTAVDTADVYNVYRPGGIGGESESTIGAWMRSRHNRAQVIVATKVGARMAEGRVGLSRQHILRSADESLARLQTDYIDIYQAHMDDTTIPLEETLSAFAELITSGKVRALGASQYSAVRLSEALATSQRLGLPRFEVLQPLYNLCERGSFEGELASICTQQSLGVITYFGLAAGFLTGKYRDSADLKKSWRGTMVQKYLNPKGLQILNALDKVSQELGVVPAQVALSWQMHNPAVTAPIASASKEIQVKDLVGATNLSLDAAHMELLDAASGPVPARVRM